MSSAKESTSVFVYGDDNLQDYRAWIRSLREWARDTGGQLLEQHLLGELVPQEVVEAGVGGVAPSAAAVESPAGLNMECR